MSAATAMPVLNHELAGDETAWMAAVHADFAAARSAAGPGANPKEILRAVLARPEYQLPSPLDLTGPGPWRGGRNRHGRNVSVVFLPRVELHTHNASRTDQFPMYVVGEADAFSLDASGDPVLTPILGGDHFHNGPGDPHAFVPRVGRPVPENWEIVFIAITPRNLQEDTQRCSDDVRAAYRRIVGQDAPLGI